MVLGSRSRFCSATNRIFLSIADQQTRVYFDVKWRRFIRTLHRHVGTPNLWFCCWPSKCWGKISKCIDHLRLLRRMPWSLGLTLSSRSLHAVGKVCLNMQRTPLLGDDIASHATPFQHHHHNYINIHHSSLFMCHHYSFVLTIHLSSLFICHHYSFGIIIHPSSSSSSSSSSTS